MAANRKFLTTPAAAKYIGRHRSSLDKWRAEDLVLPYYQDGQKVFYDVEDLDAYLDSKKVEPIAYGHGRLGPSLTAA